MSITIEKVPGGLMIDGIRLLKGKCGCSSIAKCCYSWAKIKKRGSDVECACKMTDPDTKDNYNWGYTVRKDGTTVTVKVEDARDKEIFSGHIPPPVSVWEAKGWEVVEKQGDREDGVVWRCAMCKWLYKDNVETIAFDDLPDNWKCPKCGVPKKDFELIS